MRKLFEWKKLNAVEKLIVIQYLSSIFILSFGFGFYLQYLISLINLPTILTLAGFNMLFATIELITSEFMKI